MSCSEKTHFATPKFLTAALILSSTIEEGMVNSLPLILIEFIFRFGIL